MEDLRVLVKLVLKNKIKKIELIGEGDFKYQVFYDELLSGNFKDEKEVEEFFFLGNKN